eukprot:gene46315-14660_t
MGKAKGGQLMGHGGQHLKLHHPADFYRRMKKKQERDKVHEQRREANLVTELRRLNQLNDAPRGADGQPALDGKGRERRRQLQWVMEEHFPARA